MMVIIMIMFDKVEKVVRENCEKKMVDKYVTKIID
jgi:hypothetical protein